MLYYNPPYWSYTDEVQQSKMQKKCLINILPSVEPSSQDPRDGDDPTLRPVERPLHTPSLYIANSVLRVPTQQQVKNSSLPSATLGTMQVETKIAIHRHCTVAIYNQLKLRQSATTAFTTQTGHSSLYAIIISRGRFVRRYTTRGRFGDDSNMKTMQACVETYPQP